MLNMCVFVPFLHAECPKPYNVPKTVGVYKKEYENFPQTLVDRILEYRLKVSLAQNRPLNADVKSQSPPKPKKK